MSNTQRIKNVLARMSGQSRQLTIPRLYIDLTGDLNAALLLSQCVFWSDKSKRRDGWFYKSHGEWLDEICLSPYQVRRATKKIAPWVDVKLKKANGAPTRHYRVRMEALEAAIIAMIDSEETSQSDSEETSQSKVKKLHNDDSEETSQSLTESTRDDKQRSRDTRAPSSSSAKSKQTDPALLEIAAALSDITGSLNGRKLATDAARLAEGLGGLSADLPGDLRKLYGAGGAWYTRDWRGQKGSAPNTGTILETFKTLQRNPAATSSKPKKVRR
jgi:hypothetical protein